MRRFVVHEAIFTAQSYGKFMLRKQFRESHGATQNPAELTEEQIEAIGLEILQERMMEDEKVYELSEYGSGM